MMKTPISFVEKEFFDDFVEVMQHNEQNTNVNFDFVGINWSECRCK